MTLRERAAHLRLREIKAEIECSIATVNALRGKPKGYVWSQLLFAKLDALAIEAEQLAVICGRAPSQPQPPKQRKKAA